jgi:HD-GYP domain-containing protein (c-di-GMP phosphodiesterase class II)
MKDQLNSMETENKRLRSLLHVTQSLAGMLDLDSLLIRIMEVVKNTLNADRCTVFLLDLDSNELWSKVALGIKKEIRFPADKGIAGYVASTGKILNIPDAYKDKRFNPEIDKKTGYTTKNMLTMPMRNNRNEIMGVFQVLNKFEGVFEKDDEELLAAISSIAAASIENAQLYNELRKSFKSFIETLSTTLDARDYITSGHSRRVTLYAVEIAQMMRLKGKEIDLIQYAALLHDIGKLGVPEIVLFKNKKLTEDEYEVIKRHASLSKNILNKIHFQRYLKDIPLVASSHHEKIDGTGYPEGLKGDEIPLGGRIIAVCDVFDALTSRRQYRDRMEVEKVVNILEKETGASFEPFVVYQFKNILLNVLIGILEFGYNDSLDTKDLEFLKHYTLKDLLQYQKEENKTDEQTKVITLFQKYYMRNYR